MIIALILEQFILVECTNHWSRAIRDTVNRKTFNKGWFQYWAFRKVSSPFFTCTYTKEKCSNFWWYRFFSRRCFFWQWMSSCVRRWYYFMIYNIYNIYWIAKMLSLELDNEVFFCKFCNFKICPDTIFILFISSGPMLYSIYCV